MKEFLTFTDLELEFLYTLGIDYRTNYFCNINTNNAFNCIGTKHGPIKAFGSSIEYDTYEFKGKDGTITFIRSNQRPNELIPTIIVKLKNVELAIGESYDNEPYRDIGDNISDDVKEIMKDMRSICIQVRTKLSHGHEQPSIIFRPKASDIISSTLLLKGVKNSAEIKGTMSGLSLSTSVDKNIIYNGVEAYEEVLKNTLDSFYTNDPVAREYLHMFVPILLNAYNASLYIPSIFQEKYKIEYTNRKAGTSHYYDNEIEKIKSEKQQALSDIHKQEEMFNSIVGNFSIEQAKKK